MLLRARTISTVCLSCALTLPAGGRLSAETILVDEAQVTLIQNTLIASPISGVVAEVHVREGDDVSIGSPLVRLDSEQAEDERRAAQAAHQAARLEGENDVDARYATRTLDVRRREWQQSLEANENFSGAVSETEIEKLRLVVDQSELAIEQAQHQQRIARARADEKSAQVRIANTRVDKHRIAATAAGMVVEVAVEAGEWVDAGKPVARVISLDPIRVECFIDGGDYRPDLVGRPVEFTAASRLADETEVSSNSLQGTVSFVSPEIDPVTGQVRLWATIENPRRTVLAGMQGRLVIRDR